MKRFLAFIQVIALTLSVAPTSSSAATFRNEHPAKVIVGHNDMTTIGVSGSDADKVDFNANANVAITADGKLLVADRQNHRILVFNAIPATSGAAADYAIGQDDLTSKFIHRGNLDNDNNPAPCAWGLYEPISVAVGPAGEIAVADRQNQRVLIWKTLPTKDEVTAKKPADLVLGQKNFETRGGNQNAWGLSDPEDVAFHGKSLVVADREGNRVLIWKDYTTASNGQEADIVLGQPDLTTFNQPEDQGGIRAIRAVAVGPNGALLASGLQDWVYIWKSFPAANNQKPDVVLGEHPIADIAKSDKMVFNDPHGLAISNAGQLAIGDKGHGRVLIYNSIPTSPDALPDIVLGATDHTIDATTGSAPRSLAANATTYDNRYLGSPTGLEWGPNGILVVTSVSGEWVKIFDPEFFVDLPTYAGKPEISPKDALVPAGDPIQLAVKKGQPPYRFAMVPNNQPEGYCPTTLDAEKGIIMPGLFTIHDGTNRTAQLFTVTDANGDVDTASILVFPKVQMRAISDLYPNTTAYLEAWGGLNAYGEPFTFTFAGNASGGSILLPDPEAYRYQTMYQSGSNAGKDVIEAADKMGNKARMEVTVGAPPVVSPVDPSVEARGTIQFDFEGGIFPRSIPSDQGQRSWMFVENNSGGSIGHYDGIYTAGLRGGKDIIALHEPNGYLVRTTVTVTQVAPELTSAVNASGHISGGAAFKLAGRNFDPNATVTVGGSGAIVQSVNEYGTELTALAPATTEAGKKDIMVTTGGGTATLVEGFEYVNVIPAEQFIRNLYPALLGFAAEASSVADGVAKLNTGTPRKKIALDIMTGVIFRQQQIQRFYEAYLRRRPSTQIEFLTAMSKLPSTGVNFTGLEAFILSSNEYFSSRGGGTARGYAVSLITDLLGRPPQNEGEIVSVQGSVAARGRSWAVHNLLKSTTSRALRYQTMYNKHLGRSATDQEITKWMSQYYTQEYEILAEILATDEFASRRP